MSEESAAKFVKAVLADEELHKRYQSAAYRLCAVYSRAYNVMSRFITP
ncbi:MAG: Nif11-like leader peptide family natural product precursor [Ruminiclostridium sp.]|nr:Nif11-like leader peptide family natural product precursor [Ruminiclostridium sp.]